MSAHVNLWQEKQQEVPKKSIDYLRTDCYRLCPSLAKIHSASQKITCFQDYKICKLLKLLFQELLLKEDLYSGLFFSLFVFKYKFSEPSNFLCGLVGQYMFWQI